MPFYQMLCITAHYPEYVSVSSTYYLYIAETNHVQKHIKGLVTQTAQHIMNNGGVVRNLKSWGTLSLPERMHRNKQYYSIGE